jgi:translation initiation factor 2 subunit 1
MEMNRSMTKHTLPEVDELIVCTVRSVKNFGAFVSLDEYEGREGFIHLSEIAPGWVKYIRDHIREEQKIVCKVLRVDPTKGHIDLSLKRITEHQKREKIKQWKNEQKAKKLIEIVSMKLNKSADWCYNTIVPTLIEEYGTLYGAFEDCVNNKKSFEKKWSDREWYHRFVEVATDNIEKEYVTIDGYLELTCPLGDGIDHIKKALQICENSDKVDIMTTYIGAPKYRVCVNALNYKIAERELKKRTSRSIQYITSHKGIGKFYREE